MNTEKHMSGFEFIDETTGGFLPGKLYLIESGPAVGKTTLLPDIALFNALSGKPVMFFSIGSTAEEIYERLRLKPSVRDSGKHPRELPITVFDDLIGIEEIRERLQEKEAPGLVCIDGVQLIKPDVSQLDFEGKSVDETAGEEIILRLKSMAEELNVSIIVTSQLSRASKSETVSGKADHHCSFTHIADAVIYLFKREYEDFDGRGSIFALTIKEELIDVLITSGEKETVEHGWLIFDKASVSFCDAPRL